MVGAGVSRGRGGSGFLRPRLVTNYALGVRGRDVGGALGLRIGVHVSVLVFMVALSKVEDEEIGKTRKKRRKKKEKKKKTMKETVMPI